MLKFHKGVDTVGTLGYVVDIFCLGTRSIVCAVCAAWELKICGHNHIKYENGDRGSDEADCLVVVSTGYIHSDILWLSEHAAQNRKVHAEKGVGCSFKSLR